MPVGPNGEALPYPGEQGGGLPSELAALLGGGEAPGQPLAGNEAAPQDAAGYVQSILDMVNEWRQAEQDPEDLLVLEKISTLLQQISTSRAKEAQDAMQGKLSPRILAQAYG